MEVKKVTSKEEIEELRNRSALTMEGLLADENNLKDFEDWIKQYTPTDKIVFHIISGKLMSDSYHLTGDNRYPDDLEIVSVTGIDQGSIAIPRFQIGARWLDDIIDNNIAREKHR